MFILLQTEVSGIRYWCLFHNMYIDCTAMSRPLELQLCKRNILSKDDICVCVGNVLQCVEHGFFKLDV
jgi:hypothetical protein